MYYVDSHLHLSDLTWENLKSMSVAGVKTLVTPAMLGAAKPVSNEAIKDIWDFYFDVQLDRTKEHGIDGYILIGICPVSTPSGDLSELIDALPDYLKRPEVVGIGEIGVEPGSKTTNDLDFQEEIVVEQLKLLKEFNKAAVFHIPLAPDKKVKYTVMMINLCVKYGIPMEKVVIDHCSDANIKIALDAGAYAAITVQPWRGITPEIAAGLTLQYGCDRVMIDSDCGGGISDPLSVPKTAYELRKKGASEDIIKKACYSNALEVYSLDGCE